MNLVFASNIWKLTSRESFAILNNINSILNRKPQKCYLESEVSKIMKNEKKELQHDSYFFMNFLIFVIIIILVNLFVQLDEAKQGRFK